MKDSFYFPHDYHARHDPKLAALIKLHGMGGYGTWWDLVEILHENGGKLEKFPKLITGLAQEMKQDEATLEALIFCFINDLRLLKEDATHIWSERVLQNITEREEKRLQRVEAGRVGGIHSGEIRRKTKQNEAPLEANEPKESKVKESKVNTSSYLPAEKIERLLEQKLGKIATTDMIFCVLKEVPEKMWWKVDAFLKDRYKGGGNGFTEATERFKKQEAKS